MPAVIGNQYNRKWNLKKAILFFKQSIEILRENESIKAYAMLAEEQGTYKDFYTYAIESLIKSNTKLLTDNNTIELLQDNEGNFIEQPDNEIDCTNLDELDYENELTFTPKVLLSLKRQIDTILESRLIKSGFVAKNPIFSMFILKCNHNYLETQKIDITNSDKSMRIGRLKPDDIKQISEWANDQL